MKIVANCSGGADSCWMIIEWLQQGYELDAVVFADTLYEYDEMYVYLDEFQDFIGIKIHKTRPDHDFEEWFYKPFSRGKLKGQIHGFPYVITPCWYQREAKAKPLDRFNKKYDRVLVGYTFDEQDRKMQNPKFAYPNIENKRTSFYCKKALDSLDMLNPLYKKFNRLGCYMCPKQSLEALIITKRDYPELWDKMLKWEKDSPHGFKPDFRLCEVPDREWRQLYLSSI